MTINERDLEKLVRLSDGRATPAESEEIRAWLAEHPDLQEEARRQGYISLVLEEMMRPKPMPVPQSGEEYLQDIWRKIEMSSGEDAPKVRRPVVRGVPAVPLWRRMFRFGTIWAPAAAACLVLTWIFFFQSGLQVEAAYPGYQEVDMGTEVSSITMESDTICIEMVISTYGESSSGT